MKWHVGNDGMLTLIVETSEQSSFDQEALEQSCVWRKLGQLQRAGMSSKIQAWDRQTCRIVSSTSWPLACKAVPHLCSMRECKPSLDSGLGGLIRRLGNRTRCSDRLEGGG